MLKEEQVLKMYNFKMEHVAMAVYSPKERNVIICLQTWKLLTLKNW